MPCSLIRQRMGRRQYILIDDGFQQVAYSQIEVCRLLEHSVPSGESLKQVQTEGLERRSRTGRRIKTEAVPAG